MRHVGACALGRVYIPTHIEERALERARAYALLTPLSLSRARGRADMARVPRRVEFDEEGGRDGLRIEVGLRKCRWGSDKARAVLIYYGMVSDLGIGGSKYLCQLVHSLYQCRRQEKKQPNRDSALQQIRHFQRRK